jgi:hypothetical protein
MIPGWKDEIEGEYLELLRKNQKLTPAEVAARFSISECCAVYWLTELAREGKVQILAVKLVEDAQASCDQATSLACQRKAFCPAGEQAELAEKRG